MSVNPEHGESASPRCLTAAPGDGKQPVIWVLLGPHAGDNNQVLALAEALGLPFEAKRLHYNGWRHLRPRLLGARLLSLTAAARRAIAGPPPDLTISTGIRSVPVVRALRRRSGGAMRCIHLGDPRIDPDLFDLVVTTPEYPASDKPGTVRVPLALTRKPQAPDTAAIDALAAHLPAPRHLLLLGGDTLFWRLRPGAVTETLDRLEREAAGDGGSLCVATSPRTSASLTAAVRRRLARSAVPNLLTTPGSEPSLDVLIGGAADIHVSADSTAMISESIAAGTFRGMVAVNPSAVGSLYIRLLSKLAPSRRLRPRDMRRFWAGLGDVGCDTATQVERDIVGRAKSLIATGAP